MLSDWNLLSDDLQLKISRQAMHLAARSFAEQAETLAEQMEAGAFSDRGGAEALRFLAAFVRSAREDQMACAGRA